MWFELFMIPFALVLVLFVAFWIVQEGTRWQKHRFLGVFARFIQASPGRAFMTFLILTVSIVPSTLGLMLGNWMDVFDAGGTPSNTTDIVNLLLIMFLMLAFMIAVLWGSFSTWRQSVRQVADVRVRSTQQ
ncbi:MAG: hypothetical protein ACW98Y_19585 [Candidatus Thorarchaeota archaeon]